MKKILLITYLLLFPSIAFSQINWTGSRVKADTVYSTSGRGTHFMDSIFNAWWRGHVIDTAYLGGTKYHTQPISTVIGQADTNGHHLDTLVSHNSRINSAIQRGQDTSDTKKRKDDTTDAVSGYTTQYQNSRKGVAHHDTLSRYTTAGSLPIVVNAPLKVDSGGTIKGRLSTDSIEVNGISRQDSIVVGKGASFKGNVGIGTTGLDSALTVAFGGHFTGGLKVDGNIVALNLKSMSAADSLHYFAKRDSNTIKNSITLSYFNTALSTWTGSTNLTTLGTINASLDIQGTEIVSSYSPPAPTGLTCTPNYGTPAGYLFTANGRSHNLRIYSYKTINATRYYSATYATLVTNFQDDNSARGYSLSWEWTEASGVDGYRILKYDDQYPMNYDYCYSNGSYAYTDFTELASDTWLHASTVTPNSLDGLSSQRIIYDATHFASMRVGLDGKLFINPVNDGVIRSDYFTFDPNGTFTALTLAGAVTASTLTATSINNTGNTTLGDTPGTDNTIVNGWMLVNPGTNRTVSSMYISDYVHTTTPHALLVVDRKGPVPYSAPDETGAAKFVSRTDPLSSIQPAIRYGLDVQVSIGTGGLSNGNYAPATVYGARIIPINLAAATVTNLIGITIHAEHQSWMGGGAATISTNAIGIKFGAHVLQNGTITNAWGAYFDDQTVGGTENAAIRFETTGKLSWNNDTFLYRSGTGSLTTGSGWLVSNGSIYSDDITMAGNNLAFNGSICINVFRPGLVTAITDDEGEGINLDPNGSYGTVTVGHTGVTHRTSNLVVNGTVSASGSITGTQFISNIAIGTPPFVVTSTTPVTNLSIGGNAATVTNATLTTSLTVNTGTLTLTASAANTSVLTIGSGSVSVAGSNTGDQNLSGYVPFTGAGSDLNLEGHAIACSSTITSGGWYIDAGLHLIRNNSGNIQIGDYTGGGFIYLYNGYAVPALTLQGDPGTTGVVINAGSIALPGTLTLPNSNTLTGVSGSVGFSKGISIGGGSEIVKVISASITYNCGSIAAGIDSTFSIPCVGAVAGNPVSIGVSVAAEAGLIITAECTTTDVVTVRISNHFLINAVDPANRTYKVCVINF